ncbi:MAG TPA: class II fumarate hydratase [Thermoleophilia bacterium]|nr:class II fumarate hydratase [Thermoleophilia bacterium]
MELSPNRYRDGELIDDGRSRVESDAMGQVRVPAERLWGAQTQRALKHFASGDDGLPLAFYRAYAYIKKAAAMVNRDEGALAPEKARYIIAAADEVIAGRLDAEFPLFVMQSGSGTQTNMNVNEVIANLAIQLAGDVPGSKQPVHPNDDVNRSQSTNDTFLAAMHVAAVLEVEDSLLPRAEALADAVWAKAVAWVDVVKIGRTHLQDATPLTVGQEWSGYAVQLRDALGRVRAATAGLYPLAAGGTAVGTGINAPPRFGEAVAARLAELTGRPFVTAPNKFAAQASLDAMVASSASLRGLAIALFKVANDLRWLACGPRAGLHELRLPENEPGSSIMPGKVNPSAEEAAMMACAQVMGLDAAVAFAGSQGNFELNVMRPLVADDVLRSARLLADACDKLRRFSVEGAELDLAHIEDQVRRSLMLVTALSPVVGYDKASEIAHKAHEEGTTLREAALATGYVTADEFDRIVVPADMVGDPHRDLGV